MTNKQKYPNAKVKRFYLDDEWYVSLGDKIDGGDYLVNNSPRSKCTGGYHKTKELAQDALDKFMEPPEITLSEIKSQLAEAKKLIGKKFTNTFNREKQTCGEAFLALEPINKTSLLVEQEIERKGYCVAVRSNTGNAYPFSICKEYRGIQLSNQYTAERVDSNWQIEGKLFSDSFIRQAYNFLASQFSVTNITANGVTFNLDIVKKLLQS